MNHLQLTRDTLDVGKISDIASAESCGAISLFVGTTRDSFEEKKVLSLEYEAYEPMALKQLELICRELRRQWPDIRNIAICHRLGLVKIREASVVIAISSPHRGTSLNAVSFAIDELKRHVPIWKKEMYEEEAIWKENKECQWLKQMSDNPGGGTASKLNLFNKCMYYMEDPLLLSSQFVQISACEDEIKRRIQCFVEKKRDEINICNVMDFTGVKRKEKYNKNEASITQEGKDKYNDDTMTCARVNSIVVKQECSKCHLKVRRVENNIGPQTRPDYLNTLDKLMVPVNRESLESCFIGNQNEGNHARFNSAESNILKHPQILERLENLEKYLFIPQSKNDILQRLRVIEDRLLYLESISPEYIHFLDEQSQERSGANERVKDIKPTGIYTLERNLYSVSEIDTIIQSFEKRNRNHVV